MQWPGILSVQLSTEKRDVERRGKDWCNRVGTKKWQEQVVLVQQGRYWRNNRMGWMVQL